MANTIELTYKGVNYTLEYTRATVQQMEKNGFSLNEIVENRKFATGVPELFAGSFLAHHKWVKRATVDELFEKLPNKEGLVTKLIEMYQAPIEAMLADPEEESSDLELKTSW